MDRMSCLGRGSGWAHINGQENEAPCIVFREIQTLSYVLIFQNEVVGIYFSLGVCVMLDN